MSKELIVVGGGLVGAAIAYGAARMGVAVRLLDQGDVAFRASRGNFGLVWVQGKGGKLSRYARWSRDAALLWPTLARELIELTGVDVALHQPGGFWLGFSEADVSARVALLERLDRQVGGIPFEILDHAELKRRLPGLGSAVVGGSFCPLDGHANPLLLLRALHTALRAKGAQIISGVDVAGLNHDADTSTFEVRAKDGQRWRAGRVVLAAGLGNAALAPQVGLRAPVGPSRGQVLITERLKPFLAYPTNKARQTNEGTVQLGSSTEEVGMDDGTRGDTIRWMARRAVDTFPALARARLVRAWGALRVMTPDGFPIYEASTDCPGAFVATSHSGVSLAAAHAYLIGPWTAGLIGGPDEFDVFAGGRFNGFQGSYSYAH